LLQKILAAASTRGSGATVMSHIDVPRGADENYEAWNERTNLVELTQTCVVEHLQKIEGELMGLLAEISQ
jgi:hypothetical protein